MAIKRKTDEEFRGELMMKYGGSIVAEEEYKTALTKIQFYCNDCGNRFMQTPNNILRKNAKKGCKICGHKLCKALSHDEFATRMGELYGDSLTILTTYEKGDALVSCKCNVCNKVNSKTGRDWLNSKGGCMYCRRTRVHEDDYRNRVREANEYIELREFNGCSKQNLFYCRKHDIEFKKKWKCVSANGENICNICATESRSGSNHYEWRGGITGIYEHCRKVIGHLKREEFIKCGGKCAITGRFCELELHHIISFSFLVDHVHRLNNIDIKTNIGDYSEDELNVIEQAIIKVHEDGEDIWIPISKNLHRAFHSRYGTKGFTKDNWHEFVNELNEVV